MRLRPPLHFVPFRPRCFLYSSPSCGIIVPREPVRTTLRFAPSAPLSFAPSGVRSGTHSWPNVPTRGNTVFKPKTDSLKRPASARYYGRGTEQNTLDTGKPPDREERRNRDEDFINVCNVALSPSFVPQFFTT